MSNDFDLTQVAENQNNKYLSINTAIAQLAGAVGGILDVDLSSGNGSLSLTEYRRSSLFRIDGGGAPRTLTVPPVMRFAFFGNIDYAPMTIEVGASQVEVPGGTIILVWTDGTADGLQSVAGGGGGAGAFIDLSDVPSSYSGQANKLVQVNAGESGLEFTDPNAVSTIAFDLSFFVGGDPLDGELVFRFVATREFTLPAGLGGSEAWCDTYSTATGSVQFAILRNNALIGTINFAAGAEQATFTFAADVTFDPEDILDVIAPSPADATLQNVTVTLAGTRPGVGSTNGIPVGGTAGQALLKQSGTDYDADWGAVPLNEAAATSGILRSDRLPDSLAAIHPLTPAAGRFPYYTSASAAALADIESGTWTPSILGATTPGTYTYTTQDGRYALVGNILHLDFQITINAVSVAGTGNLLVAGVPVAMINNARAAGAVAFFSPAGVPANFGDWWLARQNSTQLVVGVTLASTGNGVGAAINTVVGAGTTILGSITMAQP